MMINSVSFVGLLVVLGFQVLMTASFDGLHGYVAINPEVMDRKFQNEHTMIVVCFLRSDNCIPFPCPFPTVSVLEFTSFTFSSNPQNERSIFLPLSDYVNFRIPVIACEYSCQYCT